MKRIIHWSSIEDEFPANPRIVELIQKYIDSYSLKSIDEDYFKVIRPLENPKKYSIRQLREVEQFCNVRPMIFSTITDQNITVIEYKNSIGEDFVKYSKDVLFDVTNFKNVEFNILFKLSFLCIAGRAHESIYFREKLGFKKSYFRSISNKIRNKFFKN